jgi:hypothetical protein
MVSSQPAPPRARRTRAIVPGALVVVTGALLGVLGCQPLAPTPPSLASEPLTSSSPPSSSTTPPTSARRPDDPDRHELRGAVGEADGVVPDGVTVFDGAVPAVANLDPALLGALRQAATDAAGSGITFSVTSGWRSAAYQEQLLHGAISKYGSEAAAARWVATPSTSAHVSGDAVDLGSAASTWLAQHGSGYGLCQIYRNEPWHFELRPDAIRHGCPPMYADPTHDPRMQQ